MKFFVVHTYTGHEAKVKKLLSKLVERSGLAGMFGRIIVPVERVWRIKKGKKSVEERRLFPGHILVEMESTEEALKLVNSTPGVVRLLGTKKRPAALSEDEALAVLEEMNKGQEKMSAEVPFSTGESVKIISGPFAGFVGTVDEINPERGKVRVFVTIFGRSTPIELDIIEVQTI